MLPVIIYVIQQHLQKQIYIYNISKNQQQNTNTTNIDNNIIISSINPIIASNNQNKVNNTCMCKMNNYK
jgi:hypothetical protein